MSENKYREAEVVVGEKTYKIIGDAGYMGVVGETFEPSTVTTLRSLCDKGNHALDVGANIGLTALALSQYCEKVVGVEPVPRTFDFLSKNVADAGNISVFKNALGNSEGIVRMQGNPDFLAGSFIADEYDIGNGHFTESVPIKRLDSSLGDMGLSRLDFMKVDVEGFELEVFEGGRQVLNDLQPIVYLEMNHWCLNVFRRISIPEFRERLLSVFPFVYAIAEGDYIDYGSAENAHHVNHEHIVRNKYNNLVAGFNRNEIVDRLAALKKASESRVPVEVVDVVSTIKREHAERMEQERLKHAQEIKDVLSKLDEVKSQAGDLLDKNSAILQSTSWKITAPLRAISGALRK